ncbi:MAG: YraN family protein [Magnetococcales bacterium]|nr:YraN family protein [Magnetococcales bacterium]
MDRKRFGIWAEGVATRCLSRSGYRILERNWRTRGGEIDLVAWRDGMVIFCEIKARHVATGTDPADAIDHVKQARIVRLAEAYLLEHPELAGCACRFDVVLIRREGWRWRAEVIPDAFRPGWE